jgi:MSHA biogenesis protein MshL
MKLFNKIVLFVATIISFIAISGCNNPVYTQTENNAANATQRAHDAIRKSDNDAKPLPSLVVNQGLYVDRTPINLAKDPSWLRNHIVVHGDELPFSYYSRAVAGGGKPHVLTRYQVGLDPTVKFTMNYSGNVKGALDLLSAKTGYVYTINGDDIYWQALVTKTFNIAFMPGTSDYMMGKASGSGGTLGAAAGGSGGGTTTSGFIDDSSSSQYSSLKGNLSVWDDLRNTIQQLLTSDGKVVVSQATTTVTVRDKPSNVDLVAKYIQNLNRNLSEQVLVKVEVIEIKLNSDFNFGINWDAVQADFGRKSNFILNADLSRPLTITPLTANTLPALVGFKKEPGRPTYLQSLINALQQQGKVSVVSEPRVVCLNNQVSAVRVVNQEGYLASLQLTSFGTGSNNQQPTLNNSVTSQITPGTVVTGLTLYILPKIMGDKVFLQVNADLSTNNGFDKISSTAVVSDTSPVIQVPNISQRQFNQRTVINSGETLILSGFRQLSNRTGAQQLLGSQDLGGKASQQQDIETVVLITPIILNTGVG